MTNRLFIGLLLLGVFFVACDGQESTDVRAEKAELRQKVNDQIAAIDEKINDLKEKSENAGEETRKKINNWIDDLGNQKETLRDDMAEISEASGEAWEDLKSSINSALDKVESSFNRLKNELADAN